MSSKQQIAVVALASGRSKTEAAREAGISTATLRRWAQKPDFQEALEAEKGDYREQYRYAMRSLLGQAHGVLQTEMERGNWMVAARLATSPHLASFAIGGDAGAVRKPGPEIKRELDVRIDFS